MIRLIYISTVRRGIVEADTTAILAASRRNNGCAGITGLLLFDGRRFLQALEGEAEPVLKTFARIKADPRHFACVELGRATVTDRGFGDWEMAWRRVDNVGADASLHDTVDRLVAQVPDANTRALFSSFVRITRPAA